MKQIVCFLAFLMPLLASAIGDFSYVSTSKSDDLFTLSESQKSAALYINSDDYAGVIIALKNLKIDIGKVCCSEPEIVFNKQPNQKEVVIVGTIGRSPLIDQLIKNGKLDVRSITGRWETFQIQVIDNPMEGVNKALVIVGSDKRGTIFGIYDLSQQIGVSPWYWWADVPVDHKDALYVRPETYQQSPSVKYRGIFINDEAPALTNWVKKRFGTVKSRINPPIGEGVPNYNHDFYARVFELLLRLKANYLWPAMWENAFNEDDFENSRLANEYGIVMGTSHQEPMLRSQQEWDRRYYKTLGHWNYYEHPEVMENFWREGIQRNKDYESIITLGLRGANDSEIEGNIRDNIAMIENIVDVQQTIIGEETQKDLAEVPQSWCLYKEIMDYYNEGMNIPENITLLWADDNWGNIRRLPNVEEGDRAAGAGVYYHFDYHGGPRSYQWINTNPIAKIWDQMHLAKEYGADRIWIVNVGSLRGLELPIEYFMDLAWNTDRWTNSNINEYTRLWAERAFGPEYALDIADILAKYTKYNGRRKPESLRPQTYSLIHYNEAEEVLSDYNKIKDKAEVIYKQLPSEKRDAFYHLVLFPTKASVLVNELYVAAGKNELYAQQGRASANEMASKTRRLFREDTALMSYYNSDFVNGKWNHFMDQAHLGYTSWSPPMNNSLDAIDLIEMHVPDSAIIGVALEGNALSWPGTADQAQLPPFDVFNCQRHYVEVFNRGSLPFDYTLKANVSWLSFSETKGTIVNKDKRIWVILEPSLLPEGKAEGIITISGTGKDILIHVNAFNPIKNDGEPVTGFVESGGLVSIEAEHFSKNTTKKDRSWIRVEDYGLTLSGMRATAPANALAANPYDDSPCLEYQMYLFSEDSAQIILVTSPQLNFLPKRDIRVAVSFDNAGPQYATVVPDKYLVHWSNMDWQQAVLDQSRHIQVKLKIPKKGYNTLKIWMIDPGVIVQKIIINTGGLQPSYLGPKESFLIK